MKPQLVPFEGNCPDCLIPASHRGWDAVEDASKYVCLSCKAVFMVDELTGKIIKRTEGFLRQPQADYPELKG